MSTITKVRFWEDCGFTENCLEVPSKTSSLPAPDVTITDALNVSVNDMFSQVKLKEAYTDLMNVSYIEVTYDMNNGNDLLIYGWVDSVSLASDTSGFPMTVVRWHIDYWRTYLGTAVFGSGMVRRRPVSDTMPPQSYPHRYVKMSSTQTLYGEDDIWWVVFFYVTSGETSYNRWGCFPVDVGNDTKTFYVGSDAGVAPSLRDVSNGSFDEKLGLNPDSVVSCFLSPIAPSNVIGAGTQESPYQLGAWFATSLGDTAHFLYAQQDNAFGHEEQVLVNSMSTDTEIYVLTGFNGETVGTLPWGISSTGCRARLIASATNIVMEVRFILASYSAQRSQTEGMVFDIQLPTVDVGSNAWSSYVYSGARQATIDTIRLQAESQVVSGATSALTSGVSGALGGALMGAVGGPVGMGVGALVGGLTSIFGTAVQTGVGYAYQTGAYADEMMRINDYKSAKQANSLNFVGGGFDCLNNGIGGVNLVKLTFDDYSLTQRENDLELYGATVSEPMESCQSLVDTGGPLQIANLTVRGDIPVEAKQFFRTRFAKGVRMIAPSTEVSYEQ